MIIDWLAQLAAVGWRPLPNWALDAVQMHLECGRVMLVTGLLDGVSRDAWLGIDNGLVMLHGSSGKDDCSVSEFCRRLTEPPPVVVSQPAQRRLF